MFSPVVRLAPVCRQPFHVGKRSAVVPVAGVEFVGEGGQAEFLVEMLELWRLECKDICIHIFTFTTEISPLWRNWLARPAVNM